MKTFFALIFGCILISSCSNNGPDPSNPPNTNPVSVDTLTAGWSVNSVNSTSDFEDIVFANATTGYMCDWQVGISKSNDGGHTWTHIFSNPRPLNLAVTPNGKVFFVTGSSPNNNKVYSSTNAGNTFDSTTLPAVTDGIHDVFFVDDNVGFLTASSIFYKTVDGGITWTIPTTEGNWGHPYTARLFFLSPNIGWTNNSNTTTRHTIDGATNWQDGNTVFDPNGKLCSLFATDNNTIYMGDMSGRLYKSTDGGNNFILIHTFDNAFSDVLSDIHFTDANTGYYSYSNKIYRTIDAGVHWETVVTVGGGFIFEEIYFLDAHHGWGCGTNGKVVIYQQ